MDILRTVRIGARFHPVMNNGRMCNRYISHRHAQSCELSIKYTVLNKIIMGTGIKISHLPAIWSNYISILRLYLPIWNIFLQTLIICYGVKNFCTCYGT